MATLTKNIDYTDIKNRASAWRADNPLAGQPFTCLGEVGDLRVYARVTDDRCLMLRFSAIGGGCPKTGIMLTRPKYLELLALCQALRLPGNITDQAFGHHITTQYQPARAEEAVPAEDQLDITYNFAASVRWLTQS